MSRVRAAALLLAILLCGACSESRREEDRSAQAQAPAPSDQNSDDQRLAPEPPARAPLEVRGVSLPPGTQLLSDLEHTSFVRVELDREGMTLFLKTHFPNHTLEFTRNGIIATPPDGDLTAVRLVASWRDGAYLVQVHRPAEHQRTTPDLSELEATPDLRFAPDESRQRPASPR